MTEHHWKRPEVMRGRSPKLNTPCGTLYLTLNEDGGILREVRINMGKSGSCIGIMFPTIALFISVMLQSNMSREKIKKTLLKQFDGNCGQVIWQEGERFSSCIDWIITKILEEMANRGEIEL